MDWDKLGNNINNSIEKKVEEVYKAYKKRLRQASDAAVLSKLDEVSGEIYDITYAEAERRGLV